MCEGEGDCGDCECEGCVNSCYVCCNGCNWEGQSPSKTNPNESEKQPFVNTLANNLPNLSNLLIVRV